MKALLLAGGRGTRLEHLTDFVPKALLPIGGEPVIGRIIEALTSSGIGEIIIPEGYMHGTLHKFLDSRNGFGADISYVREEENGLSGMAIRMYAARHLLHEDFLLAAADTIFEAGYIRHIVAFHLENCCDATLSVSDLGRKECLVGRSVVGIDAENNIYRIIEKPSLDEVFSTIVSTPLYIMSPKIFDSIGRIMPSKRGEYELQTAIQHMIFEGSNVKGCMNDGWNDLGNWKMLNDCYDFLRMNFKYLEEIMPPR